jgi:cytolysin-activating lysine-acyltransferase
MHKFGDVMWLLAATKEYQHWKFSRLQYIFMPPVNLQQFFLFYEDGLPICFCSYAFVSDDVLAELQTGERSIAPAEWRCGENIFFPDFVAPFGGTKNFMRTIMKRFQDDVGPGVKGHWFRPSNMRTGHAIT